MFRLCIIPPEKSIVDLELYNWVYMGKFFETAKNYYWLLKTRRKIRETLADLSGEMREAEMGDRAFDIDDGSSPEGILQQVDAGVEGSFVIALSSDYEEGADRLTNQVRLLRGSENRLVRNIQNEKRMMPLWQKAIFALVEKMVK